jgi:hypothetical protein
MTFEKMKSSMELSPEQNKQIEELSAINYSLQNIAMYLDVDYKQFLEAFNTPDSDIKYHYDRGKLMAQAEIDKANLKKAKDGSLTSIQQWKKDANQQKLENIKKKVLFNKEENDYCQLQALIERGETSNLPANIVRYYEQIDYIRSLYSKFNSKSYIISMVRLKWPQIPFYSANKLFNECLNFFNLDNDVKTQAWANIYADRLDNMAMIATEMNDLETARRLTMDAANLRGVNKEKSDPLPDGLLDRRVIVYVMDPEKLGIPKVDRRDLAEFIDKIDITESEKLKLRRDAQVEDVAFELVENEQ